MSLSLVKDKNLIAAALITIAIFMGDLLLPLWYDIWVLYLIPLFFMFRSARRPYAFSVIITLLIAGRLFLNLSDNTPFMHAVANRVTGIMGGWGVSVLLMQFRHLNISLLQARINLEKTVADRTSELSHLNSALKKEIEEHKKADNEKTDLLLELKLAHDTLEARVTERTLELTDANASLRVLLRQRAEGRSQVERIKKRLQIFIDGVTESMFMTAGDGSIVIANRAAIEFCDYCNFPDIIGKSINNILSPHYDVGEEITNALGTGLQTSFVLKRKDRGTIERFSIYPVLISGRYTGEDIILISDITKEKVLEQQLIHTEKLAALGLLVSGIAHEINNPNNFITFNVSILRTYLKAILPIVDDYAKTQSNFVLFDMTSTDFQKDVMKLIDAVEQGAKRISSIVRELREFSHKSDAEERFSIAPRELAEQVVAMCKNSALKANVEIDIIEENKLPVISLPMGTCEQALVNLVINAIHASDKDEAHVTIIIKKGLTWADYLTFIVKDNGKGMDEATRALIFDPFFTLKPRGEGTGLGLYISKMLINKLGGDITCDSTPGQGSVFIITLPKEALGIKGMEGV